MQRPSSASAHSRPQSASTRGSRPGSAQPSSKGSRVGSIRVPDGGPDTDHPPQPKPSVPGVVLPNTNVRDPIEVANQARQMYESGGAAAGGLVGRLYSTSAALRRTATATTVRRPGQPTPQPQQHHVDADGSPTPSRPGTAATGRGLFVSRRQLTEEDYEAMLRQTSTLRSPPRGSATRAARKTATVQEQDAVRHVDRTTQFLEQLEIIRHRSTLPVDDAADVTSPIHFVVKSLRMETATTEEECHTMREFMYLTQVPPKTRISPYDPYNLIVVPHSRINKLDYWTISSAGVSHFVHGQAEFIPMTAWMKEYCVFKELHAIPFFVNYKRWRSFRAWRRIVRRTTTTKCKQSLKDSLFMLNQHLQTPLVKVRRVCLAIEESVSLTRHLQEAMGLERFVELMRDQQRRGLTDLNGRVTEIADVVDVACKAAMSVHNNLASLDSELELAAAKAKRRSGGGGGGGARQRGMLANVASDEPYQRSYTELSQKRAQCRRLTSFIRMCDLMIIDALVRLVNRGVDTMMRDLHYPRLIVPKKPEDKPMHGRGGVPPTVHLPGRPPPNPHDHDDDVELFSFHIEVLLEEETLLLFPNKDSFDSKSDMLIRGLIETVLRVERCLSMERFKPYTSLGITELADDGEEISGPDITSMITGEAEYKRRIKTIKESMNRAFAEVEAQAAAHDEFRRMFAENRRVSAEGVREMDPHVDWYREALDLYKTQMDRISHIAGRQEVGLFVVDLHKLKDVLAPSPERCLNIVMQLLPVIAREKNQVLLDEISVAAKFLREKPETVQAFSVYIDFHTKISGRLDQLEVMFDTVRDMYNVIDLEKDIEVPPEDTMLFQTGTVKTMQELRNLISNAEDTRDAQIQHFKHDIIESLDELRTQTLEVQQDAQHSMIGEEESNTDEVIEYITKLSDKLSAIKAKEKEMTGYQERFQLEVLRIEEIFDVSRDVNDKLRLWMAVRDWAVAEEAWKKAYFRQVQNEQVKTEVDKYLRTMNQVAKTIPNNIVLDGLRMNVEKFRVYLPVLDCLKNQHLQRIHWEQIEALAYERLPSDGEERPMNTDQSYTVGELVDMNMVDVLDQLQLISVTATQQAALEEELSIVQSIWEGGKGRAPIEFALLPYKDQKDVYIIGPNIEDITAILEETLTRASAITTNKYCTGSLRVRADKLEYEIRYMTSTLDKWLELQRNWMYLEGIFGQVEIARQWPQDEKLFRAVDKQYKDHMKRSQGNPSVYHNMAKNAALLEQFEKNNKQLERILNSLEKKLEEKRNAFPRFYFLSNDDLLDVLAQVKNPERVQCHLLKFFDNIKRLGFSGADITFMESQEGERVDFPKPVKAKNEVEKWMILVEQRMVDTLRQRAQECYDDYFKKEKFDWIYDHPVQLVLAMDHVFWAMNVVESLTMGNLKDSIKFCEDSLANLAHETTKDLSAIPRALIGTLITLEVHLRDIVTDMHKDNVSHVLDFGWTKQLRPEWHRDGQEILFKQNNSCFCYGYEYLGALGRLVTTPVTDRIYMTITGALQLCLGAAPAGPAGTGKTETVKDLAKTIARQCIVYN
eukprot:PhM_4_TR3027/c0_g1_i1/m.46419/K10408/DNAH; dynein heavy chain, axonemal